MKKSLWMISTIVLMLSVLVGCESVQEKKRKDPIDALITYKDSYVGDSSAVVNISYILPGGENVQRVSLQTEKKPYSITIDYGLKEGSDLTKEELDKLWNEKDARKAFVNNAIAYFILVKNVDVITFNVETTKPQSFSVTRTEIEKFVGKDVTEFADKPSLWKKEIEEGIVNNPDKIKQFFQERS
ncbi:MULTISPECIES: DUF4825 domain-containing protein [Bacillus]|uniref:DUF4825 domain-containing protein n=1 Tax=Bacillus TaxID=1386 RepID=UPI0002DB9342|nr:MULTISPECIES: DUF4825 domain-containing protein [Bacillus]